jgi:WD40 repeat protein
VVVWQVASGKAVATFKPCERGVCSLAISPDGKTLALGCRDYTVRLWDLERRTETAVIKGHGGAVHGLDFSPDGKILASGSNDRTVRLWDLASVATAR